MLAVHDITDHGSSCAVTDIKRMLEQAAANPHTQPFESAAAAVLGSGDNAAALEMVEEVLLQFPKDAQLWQLAGVLNWRLRDLAAADRAFRQANALSPANPAIVHSQACVRFEGGLPASRHFEQAMRLAPGDNGMLLRHAAALIAEGKRAAAIAMIDAELLRQPAWIEGHAALARVRWTTGDKGTFISSLERALAGRPADTALWQTYLDLLVHAGAFDDVLSVVTRARAATGSRMSFDVSEAVALAETGQMGAAEVLFRRFGATENAQLAMHHMRFLILAGRYEEASALGEQMAPRDPSHGIWPYLSVAWRMLDDPRWAWLEGDPRFVGVYDIADRLPNLKALARTLRKLHRSVHEPLGQSVRGGTQTEGHLLDIIDPELRALKKTLTEVVQEHVAQLPPSGSAHPLLAQKRAPIRFAGSWSVRLSSGGQHSEHVHPSGWFSSALYISLPEEVGQSEGQPGWLSLGEVRQLNLELPPIRVVEPKVGRLVLFPSTMWHGTRPFAKGERLSVAFDVARTG